MTSPWYRRIFPTRLAAHRQAEQEFVTTRQGYRLATSTGGVLTGRGADIIAIDDPLKPEEAPSKTLRQACNESPCCMDQPGGRSDRGASRSYAMRT
jgi:hypothetical protein